MKNKPKIIKLNDNLGLKRDELDKVQQKTFHTEVDAVDQFGTPIFTRRSNQVVLGGSIYTLEKLFNVRASLNVDTLNNIMDINTENPAFTTTDVIPKEHCICLWGVGIGGSADTIGNVHPVNFYEREIGSNGNSAEMIPFRVVDKELSAADKEQYWFAKELGDGYTGYYLKSFAAEPVIKALFDDALDADEDGTEVTSDVHNTDRTEAIEVFAELMLYFSRKDGREYFDLLNEIEKARINTIALCAGIRAEVTPGKYDYKNVIMFSKLNFGNEMLEEKEITFRYRLFTN